jgi:hypothetical protein
VNDGQVSSAEALAVDDGPDQVEDRAQHGVSAQVGQLATCWAAVPAKKMPAIAEAVRPVRAGRVHLSDEVGWIDVADVMATLTQRPGHQHVIITGRDAHPNLIAAADLVVEMTKVKHPDARRAEGPARHRMVSISRVVIAPPRRPVRPLRHCCTLLLHQHAKRPVP